MGKRKPHPTRDPRACLVRERGDVIAAEIIHRAEMVAEDLRQRPPPLTARERKQASRAAAALRVVSPWFPATAPVIDTLAGTLARWGKAARRGRRRDEVAEFARTMLSWGASDLGARGLPQLTVIELMAAAVASKLDLGIHPNALENAKERMFDAWRKHHRRNLPENPEALAEAGRERLRLVRATAMAKLQLRKATAKRNNAMAELRRMLGGRSTGQN